MKKVLITSIFLFLILPSAVLAADNMCNVNRTCHGDAEWIQGWLDARQPENTNATPSQPEWTNAHESEPQVIRLATESNDINRAQNTDGTTKTTDALNGVANDPPVSIAGSVENHDLRITALPTGVSSQVVAQNQQFVYPDGSTSSTPLTSADFEKQGVTNFIDGTLCDRTANGSVICKKTDGTYTGRIEVYSCTPDQLVPNTVKICTSNYREYSGSSIDCVAEANRTCSIIQIDTTLPSNPAGSGTAYGAVICYPTSYANCGTTTAAVTTYVPPAGPTGGGTPPTTQDNPQPTPTTPPVAPQCNQACGSGCPSNLTCISGVCRNPSCTGEASCTCPGSTFQCQQIQILRGGVVIAPSQILLNDSIVFRGFASATGTTVSSMLFTITINGVAQTPVSLPATLVGGQYQADYPYTISQATSYSASVSPVSP